MTTHDGGTLRPPVSEKDHSSGPLDAPITLVEYGDFQCPHCFRAHPVVMAIQKQLGARLRFVFRNFPMTEMHPEALHAAEAAESVAVQAGPDAYWKMHHAIFQHQQDSIDALDDVNLSRYAKSAGADPKVVRRDLDEEKYASKVKADFMSGARSGVNGTPTFFINGVRFDGDWSNVSGFVSALQESTAAGD
ncbi:MAG: DsbA family protein [Gemmatimonadaceae bacterium]